MKKESKFKIGSRLFLLSTSDTEIKLSIRTVREVKFCEIDGFYYRFEESAIGHITENNDLNQKLYKQRLLDNYEQAEKELINWIRTKQ